MCHRAERNVCEAWFLLPCTDPLFGWEDQPPRCLWVQLGDSTTERAVVVLLPCDVTGDVCVVTVFLLSEADPC